MRNPPDTAQWPYSIPAVAQIVRDKGLDIAEGVTFLVGENGSGKSTIVEALRLCSPHAIRMASSMCWGQLRPLRTPRFVFTCVQRLIDRRRLPGFFLRAECMHQFFAQIDKGAARGRRTAGRRCSSAHTAKVFLLCCAIVSKTSACTSSTNPKAAFSFQSCLGLISLLDTMRNEGSQVIVATHSPLLVSLPGATLLELDEDGIHRVQSYDELALVSHWRNFLSSPERYLRHLVR